MKLNVPHFQQEKNLTCGLAVLRMIFAYYGQNISEKELTKNLKMYSFGTFFTDLGIEAFDRGYKVTTYTFHLPLLGSLMLPFGTKVTKEILKKIKVRSCDELTFKSWQKFIDKGGELIWNCPKIEQIAQYLEKRVPCLVNVNTASLGIFWKKWDNSHYLVTEGVVEKKIFVVDPAYAKEKAKYCIDREIFVPAWAICSEKSSCFLLAIEK